MDSKDTTDKGDAQRGRLQLFEGLLRLCARTTERSQLIKGRAYSICSPSPVPTALSTSRTPCSYCSYSLASDRIACCSAPL